MAAAAARSSPENSIKFLDPELLVWDGMRCES